jgi:hypothetical protein
VRAGCRLRRGSRRGAAATASAARKGRAKIRSVFWAHRRDSMAAASLVLLLRNLRLSKVYTRTHGRDPPANRWIVALAATARDGDAAHLGHRLQIITLSTIPGCCRPIRGPRPDPGRVSCAGIAWEAKEWRDPSPRTKRASAAYDGYHAHHCVPGCFRVSRFSVSPLSSAVFEE